MTEKTVTEWLRERLLQRVDVQNLQSVSGTELSLEEIREQECGDGFCEMMDNRLIMGYLRYGAIKGPKEKFRGLKKARERLGKYEQTGNLEYLVDASNFCRVEFNSSQHLNKHFRASDRE